MQTLENKYNEASVFQAGLFADLRSINESYESSQADLTEEFDRLLQCLHKKKAVLLEEVNKELELKRKSVKVMPCLILYF